AVDAVSAYWTELDNGAIGRVNKLDGGGLGYLITQHGFASSVAVNGPSVYFATTSEVGAVASNAATVAKQSDPAVAPFTTIYPSTGSSDYNPYGIAVDDTNV